MGRIPNTLADLSVHHLVRIIIKAVCMVWGRGNPRLVSSLSRFFAAFAFPFYIRKRSHSLVSSAHSHAVCIMETRPQSG